MQAFPQRLYRFDDFELDARRRQLRRNGEIVPLQPKAFDLLVALVESGGRPLTKDDLLNLVWAAQVVEESNLTVHMSALRKALGERKGEHRFIVTEAGRGYRFVANVTQVDAADEKRSIARQTISPFVIQNEPAAEHPSVASHLRTARPFFSPLAALVLVGGALLLTAALLLFKPIDTRSKPSTTIQSDSHSSINLARLTSDGQVTAAAISPDGKHFVYATTENAGQSLWVRQVGGGRNIQIAPPEGVQYWGLTFSPGGAHVYASVFEPNRTDTQLRRIPALGGPIERLPLSPLSAIAFSPDGRRFAFVKTNAAAAESVLTVANADGSDARVLARRSQPASFDFPGPTVSWSPDGQLIASVVLNTDAGGSYMTVVGVRADGGGETPVTSKRWAGGSEAVWSPDGSLVIVAHEQPLAPSQVWLIAHPGGEVRQLTNDLNEYGSISVTADSRTLLFVQRNSIASLWVQNDRRSSSEVRQIRSEVGGFVDIAWTPDGKIVYRSTNGGGSDLWIVNSDGTGSAQLTTGARAGQGLAVSSDGRYVVFASARAGKENLWRYELGEGDLTRLTDGDGEVFPSTTPDSRWVIYQRGAGPGKPTLWRVSIDGGHSSPIVETHAMRHDLSPDGASVAYFSMELKEDGDSRWRLSVASVHDGSLVKTFEIPATSMPRVMRFTPNGQALTYIETVGSIGNIRQQPLAGGPPQSLTAFDREALDTFAYSRDGQQLAMTRVTRISDVALLRDFHQRLR
jgi:DNA-binding winged helix-turn-helix (wHTH) protein/Tol biopolymer transport system component